MFDSGGYFVAQEIRIARDPWSAVITGGADGAKSVRITIACPSNLDILLELLRGVDRFTIIDRAMADAQAEVGRFRLEMLRDDARYTATCDTWDSGPV
ncbi:hypothetical protein DB347_22685 [Opitutaceae bacterium EW11]|nr:hypothetical protein DB347_22685 [Opitutaceae bacterium EW11]